MSSAAAPTIETDADFKNGRDAMTGKDYSTAAEFFSSVLERFVDAYGQLGSECGEVYYQYGLALFRELEQNEENQDVFGPKVPQEIPTGREEDKGEGKSNADPKDPSSSATGGTEGSSAQEGGEEGAAADDDDKDESGSEESEEDDNNSPGQNNEPAGTEASNEAEGGKDGAEGGKDGAEAGAQGDGADVEDPLQLAWEVLDTARNIFKKDSEYDMRLADTLLLLGDINLRNEVFESATQDYESCLALREKLLKPDDRLLMEVHHQIAIARLYFPVPDKTGALKALRSAVRVCELRLENLNKAVSSESELDQLTSSVELKSRGDLEDEITEFEEIKEELLARIESEETISEVPEGEQPCSSTSAAPSVSDALGAGNLAAFMEKAGLPATNIGTKIGFGEAAAAPSSPVKVLGVFGKRKAQASAGTQSSTRAVDAAEPTKKARVESNPKIAEDISAAPTPSTQSPPKTDA